MTSIQRVCRILSGEKVEIKLEVGKSQVLARVCAATFKERDTCLKVDEMKLATIFLMSKTTEPTVDRSRFKEYTRRITDRQLEARITRSCPLSRGMAPEMYISNQRLTRRRKTGAGVVPEDRSHGHVRVARTKPVRPYASSRVASRGPIAKPVKKTF
jgi:hypothetical protein